MKKLSTFLIVVGLFSFICLIISNPRLILWFIISPFAIATVLFFLIMHVQPVKEGEINRRKWVIMGGTAGIIGPISMFFLPYTYIMLTLFPLSIVLLGSEFLSPILSRLLFICVAILNIGLFALMGLLLGTVVQGISRFIKDS